MTLKTYRAKRNFKRTTEPSGPKGSGRGKSLFVIQKHAARRLHYDFRLELDGVLKSWAVPKGPSTDPSERRLAVHVEDHPLDYAAFEGEIPKGEYGGGQVILWDGGTWNPSGDPRKGYAKGHLSFELRGKKLRGAWSLVQMKGRGDENWLLIKKDDEHASSDEIIDVAPQGIGKFKSIEDVIDRRVVTAGKKSASRKPAGTKSVRRKSGGRKTTAKKSARKKSSDRRSDDRVTAAAVIEGAHPGKPPVSFSPQLAILRGEVPTSEEWLHEIKFDGYRLLARKSAGRVRLSSRNGKDWTKRLPALAEAIADLDTDTALLDGELVALHGNGISDFQTLQNALHEDDTSALVLYAFDLPFADGMDLRKARLVDRKLWLAGLLAEKSSGLLRYSDHIVGHGDECLAQACKLGLEGIISKRVGAAYQSKRTRDWLKIKCSLRQEFVIGGYTDPQGSRPGFGALLLGYHEGKELIYSGRVGTGFTDKSLKELSAKLKKLETATSPFAKPPRGREIHWCRPELVGEVSFSGWTRDGSLRHPVFEGLREDKPAKQVVRETAKSAGGATSPSRRPAASKKRRKVGKAPVVLAGVRLSNPERIIFPEQGATKLDLAEYYVAVADWILPHLKGRPLSIVRCPRGREHECFYQKHLTEGLPPAVHGVQIKEKSKTKTYLVIHDLAGLISLVQFGTLELHPWPAREQSLDAPDYIVFDLDPAPDVPWKRVIAAARHVRKRLKTLGLESYLRTSGGKGLHVVVPIEPRYDWEEMRGFARNFAEQVAAAEPAHYVATMSKAKRHGKIFIDHFRNARGATSIVNYSSRARAGAPVAVPLRWNELSGLRSSNAYNIQTVPRRLSALKQDPWEGFLKSRQRLPKPG